MRRLLLFLLLLLSSGFCFGQKDEDFDEVLADDTTHAHDTVRDVPTWWRASAEYGSGLLFSGNYFFKPKWSGKLVILKDLNERYEYRKYSLTYNDFPREFRYWGLYTLLNYEFHPIKRKRFKVGLASGFAYYKGIKRGDLLYQDVDVNQTDSYYQPIKYSVFTLPAALTLTVPFSKVGALYEWGMQGGAIFCPHPKYSVFEATLGAYFGMRK